MTISVITEGCLRARYTPTCLRHYLRPLLLRRATIADVIAAVFIDAMLTRALP